MRLKQLLHRDLQRQYALEGRADKSPSIFGLLARLLHHRLLPIVLYRTSRSAMLAGIPGVPKLLTYANIVVFGLDISPRCEIGPGLFLPHTTGTVVGAWRIGENVTIFQGVTLGAKEADMNFDISLRPEVGSDVVLGAGSKILGSITIGNGATVGANSVVLQSIPAGATAVGIPARIISKQGTAACN